MPRSAAPYSTELHDIAVGAVKKRKPPKPDPGAATMLDLRNRLAAIADLQLKTLKRLTESAAENSIDSSGLPSPYLQSNSGFASPRKTAAVTATADLPSPYLETNRGWESPRDSLFPESPTRLSPTNLELKLATPAVSRAYSVRLRRVGPKGKLAAYSTVDGRVIPWDDRGGDDAYNFNFLLNAVRGHFKVFHASTEPVLPPSLDAVLPRDHTPRGASPRASPSLPSTPVLETNTRKGKSPASRGASPSSPMLQSNSTPRRSPRVSKELPKSPLSSPGQWRRGEASPVGKSPGNWSARSESPDIVMF